RSSDSEYYSFDAYLAGKLWKTAVAGISGARSRTLSQPVRSGRPAWRACRDSANRRLLRSRFLGRRAVGMEAFDWRAARSRSSRPGTRLIGRNPDVMG